MVQHIIDVRVKPNARSSTFVAEANGSYTANLHAPPVDGKASAELIALVAAHFGMRKSAVVIERGARGRSKRGFV